MYLSFFTQKLISFYVKADIILRVIKTKGFGYHLATRIEMRTVVVVVFFLPFWAGKYKHLIGKHN
jgi:hypothetical protein